MFRFDSDILIPLVVFAIPIIAIVGGITAGIVRILSRDRLIALAQRERIAAIEHGADPTKLPPLRGPAIDPDDQGALIYSPKRRAQGLLIGGLITMFVGIGLSIFLFVLNPDGDRGVWAVGMIPGLAGLAMLLSAWIIWPRGGDSPGHGGGQPH